MVDLLVGGQTTLHQGLETFKELELLVAVNLLDVLWDLGTTVRYGDIMVRGLGLGNVLGHD